MECSIIKALCDKKFDFSSTSVLRLRLRLRQQFEQQESEFNLCTIDGRSNNFVAHDLDEG